MNGSILDIFKKKLTEDMKTSDIYQISEDASEVDLKVSEHIKEMDKDMDFYLKTYDSLQIKKDVNDVDLKVNENIKEMDLVFNQEEIKTLKESEIETENVAVNIYVKKAKCPKCGAELKSAGPVVFNPFTFEKKAIHKCENCQEKINLEFAYPRVVFEDKQGNEIIAYTF